MAGKPIILPETIDLDRFISDHAHDLRTPYNHITGFSKMLLNTIENEPVTDQQKEDLETVYRSGMRALRHLNAVIDIARFNLGNKQVRLAVLSLPDFVTHGIAHWKRYSPAAGIQVETRLLSASEKVTADEQASLQLIAGCISFVSIYCESKATVTVTVEDDGDRVLFTFTSFGLKPRLISQLEFDMLGFLCRVWIDLQKGEIRRVEENDSGAVLQFSLPGAK